MNYGIYTFIIIYAYVRRRFVAFEVIDFEGTESCTKKSVQPLSASVKQHRRKFPGVLTRARIILFENRR